MLRKIHILLVATIALFSSCQSLDLNDPSTISSSDVWSDPALVNMYVNHLYGSLSGWDFDTYNNISDEARDNFLNSSPNNVLIGEWNETSNPMDNWAHCYKYIRVANDFLKEIQTASIDAETIATTSAEVRFIRAMLYFELLKRYGGVPLLTASQALGDKLEIPRNSEEECFNFIITEMGNIANSLPINADRGKITQGAAWALQARTLLYFASPLHNKANDITRWQKAADAAKKVMDLNKYSLYPDLKTLWLDMSNSHPETILEKQYGLPNVSHGWDCAVKPLDLANGDAGHCSPLQEMIDAFPMKNGKLIHEEGSGYDPAHPYIGRDDRFYADIAYNQATIRGVKGGKLTDHLLHIYKGGNDFDNPQGNPAWQNCTTFTGYLTVKAVDPNCTTYGYWSGSVQPWIEFRYAEVLLNYAEALNEAQGPKQEVYDALNLIRKRAGITHDLEQNLTKEQMKKLISNERYVELCFEHHRYWDLRRLKLAETVLNGKRYTGAVITKESDGTFTYDYQSVDLQPLRFKSHMYYMPIPMNELSKNGELKQNSGWTGI